MLAAERLAASEKCDVKVLPRSSGEMMNFLGIKPAYPQPIANLDPAFGEGAVKNCMNVLPECMFERRGSVSDWSNQAASTQEAFRSFFELIDPKNNKDSRKKTERNYGCSFGGRGMSER